MDKNHKDKLKNGSKFAVGGILIAAGTELWKEVRDYVKDRYSKN